jgi:hypothetical protein
MTTPRWIFVVATTAGVAICGPGSTSSRAAPASPAAQAVPVDVQPASSAIDPSVTRMSGLLAFNSVATIVGEHFDRGLTLTFRGTYYAVTIGTAALMAVTPTSLSFDPAGLDDGVYALSVRSVGGRVSNEIVVTVRRK